MPTPRVQAAAEGMPETHDPILALASRLQVARRRQTELEGVASAARRGNDPSKERWFESAGREAYDEVGALRHMLSMDRAATPAGALVQVGEAISLLDMIEDQFPEPEFSVQQDMRALNRILYSVLAVLMVTSNRQPDELVDDDVLNLHLDPWVPVEVRFASVQRKAA